MNEKMKHLEMIQAVINRMAGNSFMLKGWAITLVTGIFALSDRDTSKVTFLLIFVPTLGFWFLDTYYLMLEHLYRNLYNIVRQKDNETIDFDMNVYQIELKVQRSIYIKGLFSISEICFYIPITLMSIAIIIFTSII